MIIIIVRLITSSSFDEKQLSVKNLAVDSDNGCFVQKVVYCSNKFCQSEKFLPSFYQQ